MNRPAGERRLRIPGAGPAAREVAAREVAAGEVAAGEVAAGELAGTVHRPPVARAGLAPILHGKRAVIAKLGLDAYWQGALGLAHEFRDAGMEVLYLGHATVEEVVTATRQSRPALVALCSLSGTHLRDCPPVLAGLRAAGLGEVAVVVDGVVPVGHIPRLTALGIDAVFAAGGALTDKLRRVADLVGAARPTPGPDRRHRG